MSRILLLIICLAMLNGCKKESNSLTRMAIPNTQSILNFEHITPIEIKSSNDLEGTTYTWSRDKIDEVYGLYKSGTGKLITDSCSVFNNSDIEQIVTYTIIPVDQNGIKGRSFNATIHIKPEIELNGTILDKVTQQPVSGASVYLGYTFCDMGDIISQYGKPATSDANGKYKLIIPKSFFTNMDLGRCKYFFAKKNSYVGSNNFHLDYSSPSQNGYKFELYHPSKLKIRVVNDTINDSIDAVQLRLLGDVSFSSSPGFTCGMGFEGIPKYKINCMGRKFDTTYEFDNFWGNMVYKIIFAEYNSYYSNIIKSYSILLKPDELNEITVTF